VGSTCTTPRRQSTCRTAQFRPASSTMCPSGASRLRSCEGICPISVRPASGRAILHGRMGPVGSGCSGISRPPIWRCNETRPERGHFGWWLREPSGSWSEWGSAERGPTYGYADSFTSPHGHSAFDRPHQSPTPDRRPSERLGGRGGTGRAPYCLPRLRGPDLLGWRTLHP